MNQNHGPHITRFGRFFLLALLITLTGCFGSSTGSTSTTLHPPQTAGPSAYDQFVMKNGMVFKKDGVMTPEKFFHPGPVRMPSGRWTR